jgi:hypothetical protein
MPDHVHLALVPKSLTDGSVFISKILQMIKGTSAHLINRALGRRGPVWQQESLERALRQEEDVYQKLDYMLEKSGAGWVGEESTGLSVDLAEGGWARKDPPQRKVSMNMGGHPRKRGFAPTGENLPSLHR